MAGRAATRRLAAVLRLAVNVLQERDQVVAKLLVVVSAPEPAGVAKLDEFQAAMRALVLIEQPLFRSRSFGQSRLAFLLRLIQILLGTLLAQVKFFELLFTENFGNVQNCLIMTFLAFHRRRSATASHLCAPF